jgi:hypothetical protein
MEGGRVRGREEVMAGAVGKGSDSLLLPQTPAHSHWGHRAGSASLHFLPLLGMTPLVVGWGSGDTTGPEGTDLLAPPCHLPMGQLLALVCLGFPIWQMERLAERLTATYRTARVSGRVDRN